MTTQAAHPTIIGTFRSMPRPVRVLMWGTFISNLTAFLNAFLVLFLTIEKEMSTYYAGIALGALLGGRILGTAVGGALADRVGYRWTTVISMLGNAVGVAAMVHVTQPWMAIALSGLIGVIAQAYRPASQAWVMELTPQAQHVMLFSIYRLAFNVGTAVGPLVAALLVKYSYALLFYADAAAALAFGILALAVLPNDRPIRKAVEASADGEDQGKAHGYRQVLTDGRFMLVVFGLFLTAVVYIQGTAALPLFIKGTGHTEQVYAALLSLNGIMVIALEVALTKVTQRMPIQIPIVLGMLLLGIGHLLYLAPLGLSALAIGTFVWTLGEIVAAPSMLAYPGRVAPPGLRARYVAASTVPQQAGYALGPLVGVAAWQAWGSEVWVLTGSIGLLAALVTLAGAKWVPRDPGPQPDASTAVAAEPAASLTAAEPAATPPTAAEPVSTDVNQPTST